MGNLIATTPSGTPPSLKVSNWTNVNLAGDWKTVWGAIGVGTGLSALMMAIGACLIAINLVRWVWQRRSGQGGNGHRHLVINTLIGMALIAPAALIPIVLTVVDGILNGIGSQIL
jgi:hypothetical protein